MNEYKKCPYCGEDILAEAQKCKYCREWLVEQPKRLSTETEKALPSSEKTFVEQNIHVVVDSESLQEKQSMIQEVYIKTHEPAFKKTISPSKMHLDEFIIKNGILTITTKNGKSLIAPINEVEVGYTDTSVGVAYTFKYRNKRITIVEMENMLLDEELKQLNEIVESLPYYGLSSMGAIYKAFGIVFEIFAFIAIAIWLVIKCSR